MKKYGAYIGRLCPIHLGHKKTIDTMLDEYDLDNSFLFIGSCNEPMTIRNFFTYEEKRRFINTLYPAIKIIPLPDSKNSNKEWILFIHDILASQGISINQITFFGGCEEDLYVLLNNNVNYKIVHRFGPNAINVSATEIRDCLIRNISIDKLVHPLVKNDILETFKTKWEIFKRI